MLSSGMKFEETDKRFELRVTGYQFPDIVNEGEGSNWLDVTIGLQLPEGSYAASNACLETLDVAWIAKWLESVAHDIPHESQIGFTEPNLGFEHVLTDGDVITLRVYTRQEMVPPWTDVLEDFTTDFKVPRAQLEEAAASLRGQLRRFPPRGGAEAHLPFLV